MTKNIFSEKIMISKMKLWNPYILPKWFIVTKPKQNVPKCYYQIQSNFIVNLFY